MSAPGKIGLELAGIALKAFASWVQSRPAVWRERQAARRARRRGKR